MQNIIDICKEFGFEVPADKQADFNKKVSENYLTKAEHEKKLGKAENDRDEWKNRAETAEGTLKGFEGKDFDTITKERDEWKQKAESAEKEYSAKEAEREKQDLLKEAFAEVEFTSEAARKSIMAQISENISVKNGKLIGFNDMLEDAKKNDASAFVDKEQQNLENNRARFTNPANNKPGGNTGRMTFEDAKKIKDASERQKAYADMISRGELQ